jgi:hypothetical protein
MQDVYDDIENKLRQELARTTLADILAAILAVKR